MESFNRKVYILTEGSKTLGFGHITRTLSIYYAFERKGIKPKFIINGDDSIISLLVNINYTIYNWIEKVDDIIKWIKNSDILVIDSYLADEITYDKISKLAKTPVYIDDNNRINYPNGIIINPGLHAQDIDYPKSNNKTYLLGPKYTPLRKAFWNIPEKNINKDIKTILVTFGGSDVKNLTPKILKFLIENFKSIKKFVVIGAGFKDIKSIGNVTDKNTELIFYPDEEKMKQLMISSDIAISAAGQTLYELAATGTPTIAIPVAENQLFSINNWLKSGFIEYAGKWDSVDLLNNLKEKINFLNKKEIRELKSKCGKSLIDGKGSIRTVDKILEIFKYN